MARPWTVLYDFEAEEEGELSVNAGELVVVVEDTKDGWTLVETVGDQPRTGYVPGEYLGDEDEELPQYDVGDAEGAADDAAGGTGTGAEEEPWVAPTELPDGAAPARTDRPGTSSPGPRDEARGSEAGAESARRGAPARAEPSGPAALGAFTTTTTTPRTPVSTASAASSGQRGAPSAASVARSSPRSVSSAAGALVQASNGSAAGGDPVHEALSKLRIGRGSRALRKPDPLQQAASNEEFDEMIQNHQQWLESLATSRAAAFGELTGGLDRLAGRLEQSQEENEKLYTRLDSLCRLIEDERQSWERKAHGLEGTPSS